LLHLLSHDATTLQVLASTSHSVQQAATRLGQQLSVLQLQLLPLLRPAPAAAAAAAGCVAVVLTGEVLSALALLLRETGLLLVVCLEVRATAGHVCGRVHVGVNVSVGVWGWGIGGG
jgi:hypothetical protein